MGEPAEKWNKATRLAVAGMVAPHLRDQSDRTRLRRVARVDKDGNIVGYTTLAEVQEALLRRKQIELEVCEGVRPKEVLCERCGGVYKPSTHGTVSPLCDRCRSASCEDCRKPLSRAAALRDGKRCVTCAGKARQRPVAKCIDCDAPLAHKEPRPGSKPKATRCRPCSEAARRKPLPCCEMCGKTLSQSARVQPIRHCRACFRKDPEWRAKTRAAMAKALKVRWSGKKASQRQGDAEGGSNG